MSAFMSTSAWGWFNAVAASKSLERYLLSPGLCIQLNAIIIWPRVIGNIYLHQRNRHYSCLLMIQDPNPQSCTKTGKRYWGLCWLGCRSEAKKHQHTIECNNEILTLSGLTSRWANFLLWMCLNPSATCARASHNSSSVKEAPLSRLSPKLPPPVSRRFKFSELGEKSNG